jgi:UDP-GlcNAc:undecaprenyl-phosphate GlcNAc-1-phosphate transferase
MLSLVLTWIVRKFAFHSGIIDEPRGGRKIHTQRTALWGGLATGTAVIITLFCCLPFADGTELRPMQIIGFAVAILILMIGGALDDRFDHPPHIQVLFPILASLVIIISGSGIVQVTNPMLPGHAVSLVWQRFQFGIIHFSFPSDLITIGWLLVVTYSMKILDGLDGLVTGLTVISALLIASLAGSAAYFQPLIALMALSLAAIHIGFLPFNKQGSIFLGEAGSTIAGFSLAVLSIISGAKVATAAVALGIPIADIGIVVVGRLLRGKHPFKGDLSHLHFRLLQAGFSPRTSVRIIWALALVFGLTALTLQTRGRIFLFVGLVVLVVAISTWAYMKAEAKNKKRGMGDESPSSKALRGSGGREEGASSPRS